MSDETLPANPKTSRERRAVALSQSTEQLLDDAQREAVLAFITANPRCSLKEAGAAAGVRRYLISALLDREPEFLVAYKEARGYGADQIRNKIADLAIDGWDEVTTRVRDDGAVETTTVHKTSERLLGLMAKANLPEYRDTKQIEVMGHGGTPIRVEDRSASLADIARVLEAAGALRGIARPEDAVVADAATPRLALTEGSDA